MSSLDVTTYVCQTRGACEIPNDYAGENLVVDWSCQTSFQFTFWSDRVSQRIDGHESVLSRLKDLAFRWTQHASTSWWAWAFFPMAHHTSLTHAMRLNFPTSFPLRVEFCFGRWQWARVGSRRVLGLGMYSVGRSDLRAHSLTVCGRPLHSSEASSGLRWRGVWAQLQPFRVPGFTSVARRMSGAEFHDSSHCFSVAISFCKQLFSVYG